MCKNIYGMYNYSFQSISIHNFSTPWVPLRRDTWTLRGRRCCQAFLQFAAGGGAHVAGPGGNLAWLRGGWFQGGFVMVNGG